MTARRPDEPFEQYKKRRKLERKLITMHLAGKVVESPSQRKARLVKERKTLCNHVEELLEYADKLGIIDGELMRLSSAYSNSKTVDTIEELKSIRMQLVKLIKNHFPKASANAIDQSNS